MESRLREEPTLTGKKGTAVVTLFAILLLGLFLSVFVSQALASLMGLGEIGVIRLATVMQNLLAFMLPAILVGLLTVGGFGRFLGLLRLPSVAEVVGMVALYIAMTPAMNFLVAWNESLSFPEFLAPAEAWLRSRENAAQALTSRMLQMDGPGDLLLTVGSVGLLTGLCEEIFFRGAFQGILLSGKHRRHLSVWVAAAVFSLLHFQFFGFIPRMLLGAFFGYMYLWSGSLWLAVIGHALNNSTVVVATYLLQHGVLSADVSQVGATSADWMLIAGSVAMTAFLFFVCRKFVFHRHG